MKLEEYTAANKEAWNEVVPKHQVARKEHLDKAFSQKGYIDQQDKQLLAVIEQLAIAGKDVIHLCCNNGCELMSLKNMGAGRCVGIDIADLAIEEAQNRSDAYHIGLLTQCQM